jgi:hypothetical protein
VARHRDFFARRENAQAEINVSPIGRQDERRLRKVHLLCNRLHRLGGKASRVEEDRQLIAAEEAVREDVEVKIPV